MVWAEPIYLQKTTPGDGYRIRHQCDINFQAQQKITEDSKDVVAELAGVHHPYRFEPEDTSSADH